MPCLRRRRRRRATGCLAPAGPHTQDVGGGAPKETYRCVRAFLTEPTSAAAVGHKARAKSGGERYRTQQRTYRCFDETHCAMRVRRSINTVFPPLLLCAGIELSIIIIIISYSVDRAVRDSHCLRGTQQRRLMGWPIPRRRRRSRAAASGRRRAGSAMGHARTGPAGEHDRCAVHSGVHTTVCAWQGKKAEKRRQPGNLDHQSRAPRRPDPSRSVKCSPSDRVDRDWQRRFRAGV